MNEAPMLLDVNAAAKLLGLTTGQVRTLVSARAITYRRVGRRIFFTRSDIDECLEGLKVARRNDLATAPDQVDRGIYAGLQRTPRSAAYHRKHPH